MPNATMPCRKARSSKTKRTKSNRAKTTKPVPVKPKTPQLTHTTPAFPWWMPTTKNGAISKKPKRLQKLIALDPDATTNTTEKRVERFRELFAFRYTGAIITRVNAGPRSWTALKGGLYIDQVVRHLLADRIPTLSPVWAGARSFKTTTWFCIDVDADREAQLAHEFADAPLDDEEKAAAVQSELAREQFKKRRKPPTATFAERCLRVEDFFRAMGVDPHDPRQAMIQPTPSGGRHYYLFINDSRHVVTLKEMAHDFGIRESPGEFEFFPSESRAIRLPFGYIPGQQHDPKAWVRFIDDYHAGRIQQHSMTALYEKLHETLDERRLPRSSVAISRSESRPATKAAKAANPSYLGIPKRDRIAANVAVNAIQRFREIVTNEKQTFEDAKELITLGIRLPGHRTETLKILAEHLIWIKHESEQDATDFLTAWANNPVHESKDIKDDLANGTNKVARQIASLCRWYAERKKTKPRNHNRPDGDTRPKFAVAEMLALREHVRSVPEDEQTDQAHFLLSFLAFAKQHGTPNSTQVGWQAAPAIAKIVRRWPGCNHQDYKTRMQRAEEAGLFKMVREKWQNPNGKGRARTYHLAVPVVAPEEWMLDYDAALTMLTDKQLSDHSPLITSDDQPPANQNDVRNPTDEPKRCSRTRREAVLPSPVRAAAADGGLGPCSHQRHPQRAAAFGVPRQVAGGMRAVRPDAGRHERDVAHVDPVGNAVVAFLNAEDRVMMAFGLSTA